MTLRNLAHAVVIGLFGLATAACHGVLDLEGSSEPATLSGLDPAECPAGWTGDTLPSALQDHLDTALTHTVLDVRYQIEAEALQRNVGPLDTIRFDDLVLHTESATAILSAQNTLGFLQELRIYLEPTRPGSKLDRALLARHDHISETATAIILEPTTLNAQPYFKEGFRVVTEVVPRSCLAEDLVLRLSFHAKMRYLPE